MCLRDNLATNPELRIGSLYHYLGHVVAALDALEAEQKGHPLFKLRLLAVALTDLSRPVEHKSQGADAMAILEEMIKELRSD
jgi:2-oxoglutarate dehydrogenase complex dehydrogenase (E1) component-like enzyme